MIEKMKSVWIFIKEMKKVLHDFNKYLVVVVKTEEADKVIQSINLYSNCSYYQTDKKNIVIIANYDDRLKKINTIEALYQRVFNENKMQKFMQETLHSSMIPCI